MTDPWKEPVCFDDFPGDENWLVCGACEGSWRADAQSEHHEDGCPVQERDQLRVVLADVTTRLTFTCAQLSRARAAGRRLAAYWRVQADGEESLRESFTDHWFQNLSRALGFPHRATFSEILNRIHRLREAPETSDRHDWLPLARTVQYMVGLERTPIEDLTVEALQEALYQRDQKRIAKLARASTLRRAAEEQCARMRKRWLDGT